MLALTPLCEACTALGSLPAPGRVTHRPREKPAPLSTPACVPWRSQPGGHPPSWARAVLSVLRKNIYFYSCRSFTLKLKEWLPSASTDSCCPIPVKTPSRGRTSSRTIYYRHLELIHECTTLELKSGTLTPQTKQRHIYVFVLYTFTFQMGLIIYVGLLLLTPKILSLPFYSQVNAFLSWAHSYAAFHNWSNCWACGTLPSSSVEAFLWWTSPL